MVTAVYKVRKYGKIIAGKKRKKKFIAWDSRQVYNLIYP